MTGDQQVDLLADFLAWLTDTRSKNAILFIPGQGVQSIECREDFEALADEFVVKRIMEEGD